MTNQTRVRSIIRLPVLLGIISSEKGVEKTKVRRKKREGQCGQRDKEPGMRKRKEWNATADSQLTSRVASNRQFPRESKMQVTVCLPKLPSIYTEECSREETRRESRRSGRWRLGTNKPLDPSFVFHYVDRPNRLSDQSSKDLDAPLYIDQEYVVMSRRVYSGAGYVSWVKSPATRIRRRDGISDSAGSLSNLDESRSPITMIPTGITTFQGTSSKDALKRVINTMRCSLEIRCFFREAKGYFTRNPRSSVTLLKSLPSGSVN